MKLGRLEIALAALLASSAMAGCKKDGADATADGAGAPKQEEGVGGLSYDPASEKSYKVRGVVRSDIRDGVVMIYHEKIADFANRQNEVKGMMPMEMGFAVGEGIDPGVLAKGAKVAIEFDVRWKQNPPLRMTSATALDPATELVFEGSLPATPPPGQGGHEHGSGQGGGQGGGGQGGEGGHEHGSGQGGGGHGGGGGGHGGGGGGHGDH